MFSKGKSISAFPVKVLYDFVDDVDVPLKAGVTVSSRKFKKAVERNRVKRVLREAYRLQKLPLEEALEDRKKKLILFFIYLGKELPVFIEVKEKVQFVLKKLTDNIVNKSTEN